MLIIGEKIHIVSPVVKDAVKGRDPRPLQEIARKQAAGGADYLDVNLGPRGGGSPETMAWAVIAPGLFQSVSHFFSVMAPVKISVSRARVRAT